MNITINKYDIGCLRDEIDNLLEVFEDLDSDAERIADHVGNRAHALRGFRNLLNAALKAQGA